MWRLPSPLRRQRRRRLCRRVLLQWRLPPHPLPGLRSRARTPFRQRQVRGRQRTLRDATVICVVSLIGGLGAIVTVVPVDDVRVFACAEDDDLPPLAPLTSDALSPAAASVAPAPTFSTAPDVAPSPVRASTAAGATPAAVVGVSKPAAAPVAGNSDVPVSHVYRVVYE